MSSRSRQRTVALFVAFCAADVALALVACSSSSPDVVVDEGTDATTESAAADAARDTSSPPPDATADAGIGNCSPATGTCDLVRQDCPSGKECTVNAAGTTACTPTDTSQQLPLGRACCPGATNPCLPGLQCIGNACSDGGTEKTGRCTPACCKGADQACGKSDPEGISGTCNLTIVDDKQTPLFDVCTYSETCKPFHQQPCKAGETCLLEDKVGTASCFDSSGKTNGQACTFANECADGLLCLSDGDAGACHYACLFPGSVSPFDAGLENAPPGSGGCAASEACHPFNAASNLPAWYGVCTDGG